MKLADLLERARYPEPWSEGEKIPWDEPGFSRRMLNEHLTQDHDLASRRTPIIQQHVDWIHANLLGNAPGRILDLGCGPGLYCSRLAGLGHTCHGIDFSPASIDYAQTTARKHGLSCTYLLQDLRTADFGEGYDLVMFIFGELNAFRPPDAQLDPPESPAGAQTGEASCSLRSAPSRMCARWEAGWLPGAVLPRAFFQSAHTCCSVNATGTRGSL